MISTVIFDMDGLMVDSEPMHYESVNRVLSRYGVELSSIENARYVGVPDVEAFADLVVRYRLPVSSVTLVAEKRATYLGLIAGRIVAQPGLYRLLDRLEADGYALAVASSSPIVEIELILGRLEVKERFRGYFSAEQVARGKPAPDLFLHAASQVGAQPACCLVLEDAPSGVRAAQSAGMTCFAVPSEAARSGDFSPADRVLASLDEVYPALAALQSVHSGGRGPKLPARGAPNATQAAAALVSGPAGGSAPASGARASGASRDQRSE